MLKRSIPVLLTALLVALMFSAAAQAEVSAPGYEVFGYSNPTDLAPGGTGLLELYVYNIGGAVDGEEGPTLVDELPEGLVSEDSECKGDHTREVTCQLSARGQEFSKEGLANNVTIPVRVESGASNASHPVDRVSVSGGGALGSAATQVPVIFGAGTAPAGLANTDLWVSSKDGLIDTQAGSHPYELTFMFAQNNYENEQEQVHVAGGEAQALDINLPPGLVGEPSAVPECTRKQFDSEEAAECPAESIIGEDQSFIASGSRSAGHGRFYVYNLVPPPGVAAQFGFIFTGVPIFIDARVRSGGDFGITSHSNIPQKKVVYNLIRFWGTPGEHEDKFESKEEHEKSTGLKPFLTLPTSCTPASEAPQFSVEELGTWQHPEETFAPLSFPWHNNDGEAVGITGCERLTHFKPSIELSPEASFSDTPTGLTTTVRVPQGLNPEGLATSGLKETTVTLPEGVAINPGQATGLVACQPGVGAGHDDVPLEGSAENGELEAYDGPPECPAASKVGTDEISTPLLPHPLKGDVYILPNDPPNLQLLVAASGEGVNLKLIGEVHLNEQTGRLTTTFKGTPLHPGTPDAPLNEFKLAFSGGAQAALVTPSACGVYTSSADFTPWSSPFVQDAFVESNFPITSGPAAGGSCSNPLPFNPVLTAGATTDQAGGYTDFSMLLTRGDGQQRIDGLQFKAPAGLTGFLSHVPLCTNAQAESNMCPEASKIGHTVVESGPGPDPLVIPEPGQPPAPIYLTEGYGGAPFGLSIVVPIHAGPFTLETQRVRARIEINPVTSALTVTTNPLPQVVAGIPTDLREVDAVIERPEFMVNPTNCNPQEFSGTAYGTPPPGQGGPGASAAISSHFQVGACQALKFEPKFSVQASGKNSKADGASLTAKLTYPNVPQGTDTDIGFVKIELPKQLPSRLTTLQKACTSAQFEANPATCPAESKIGYATVHTPLLPVPLVGPVIFVSHGDEAFPSLTVLLQGDGVTIDLVGSTFISKAGITSTTFKTIPDDPFSTFELTLPQGKYSALAANVPSSAHYSLCGQKLVMPNEFVAQNGAVIKQSTAITITGCAKAKKKTLTRAQKLTKALKACKKDKSKTKRVSCEKQAHKRYRPVIDKRYRPVIGERSKKKK